MKPYGWDSSFEEQSTSEQEAEDLKEVASMISNMERTEVSSSFQARLKESLMAEANPRGSHVARILSAITRPVTNRGPLKLRPIYAVAVVIVLFFTFSTFSNGLNIGPVRDGAFSTDNGADTFIVVNGEEEKDDKHRQIDAAVPQEEDEEEDDDKDKDKDEDREEDVKDEEEEDVKEDKEQKEDEKEDEDREVIIAENGDEAERETDERDPAEEKDEEKTVDDEDKEDRDKEPEFKILEDRRSFEFAGSVKISPFYSPAEEESELNPVENVDYSWPHPFTVAVNDEKPFASKEWGEEFLSKEGFLVSKNNMQIDTHETEEEKYAEIFFRPEGSSPEDPQMVAHVQKDEGIISYYYEEEGRVLEPGFYQVSAPREVFDNNFDSLEVFASSAELSFSINQVWPTYHEFTVEMDEEEEPKELPAYGYKGVLSGDSDSLIDSDFEIFLPALEQ